MLDGKNISKLLNIVMLFIYDNVFFFTDNNTFLYKINREFFLNYVWWTISDNTNLC